MPAFTYAQKTAISQFVGFTQTKENVAVKTLKQHDWNVELAIDAFFHGKPSNASPNGTVTSLNKLFDRYRDDPINEPDTIGIEGSMRYLTDLGVKLDEVACLVVLTELSVPTMGEINREGFVQGWKPFLADTLPKQQALIPSFRHTLAQNPALFKRVYKTTFLVGRPTGQKSLPLDSAIDYWRILLQPPSHPWTTPTTPWLEWWIAYLQDRWRKAVSKDMWEQTGAFVQKSLADESMAWWSEDGAWPGVLDDFVGYVKERRKGGGSGSGGVGGGGGGAMDVEGGL